MQKFTLRQPDAFWLVILASVLWGTIGVATQAIYEIDQTTPLFINLARTVIAAPVLGVMCWHVMGQSMFNIRPRGLMLMALTGTFLVISQVAYFEAINHAGVTLSTLLTLGLSPVVVVFLNIVFKLEVFNRRLAAALSLSILGGVLLVGWQPQTGTDTNLTSGVLFSVAAALCYGCMLVCGRFLASEYHPLQVTSIGFITGAIILAVIALMSDTIIVQTSQGWLLVAYLGLVPTALAYWLFQWGLKAVSATTASIVVIIDPVVAALLAWVLFGETLTFAGLLGSVLLFVGLFLVADGEKTS